MSIEPCKGFLAVVSTGVAPVKPGLYSDAIGGAVAHAPERAPARPGHDAAQSRLGVKSRTYLQKFKSSSLSGHGSPQAAAKESIGPEFDRFLGFRARCSRAPLGSGRAAAVPRARGLAFEDTTRRSPATPGA